MARKGLSKNDILTQALEMITKVGLDNFSIREFASSLDVKPSSLYNHIAGMGEILEYSVKTATEKLYQELNDAISGCNNRDDAIKSLCYAYKHFALENKELYKLIISTPKSDDNNIVEFGFNSFRPFRSVINGYELEEKENLHTIRMIRSILHGYIELYNSGFMRRGNITPEETFDYIVDNLVIYLNKLGGKDE